MNIHELTHTNLDKTLIKNHTIITFGLFENSPEKNITAQSKKYINYPYPNENMTVNDTVIQLYYKLHEIFKCIKKGLEHGDVYITCDEPNQLSSLIVCLYSIHITHVPLKMVLGAMQRKNPVLFGEKFKYKKLLEKYMSQLYTHSHSHP